MRSMPETKWKAGTRRGGVRPLSIAPMMERTDRHYRYFMRQITKHTLLYTEMLTTTAILHGHHDLLLGFSMLERPVALQLGGDRPQQLAACARLAEEWGYCEVNLNVGCPSDRVHNGHFGVCLMAQPERVAQCVDAMRRATSLPVTVKHRLGIDGHDRFEDLAHFVRLVAQAGCDRFIVHARIALQGLNPRANRLVPPLRYADVYRLKATWPALTIDINGGVTTLEQVWRHLRYVDGVMIGRAAYDNPYLFALADTLYFGVQTPPPTRRQVLEAMLPYVEHWQRRGLAARRLLRHLLGLFAHQRVAKAWRRYLSDTAPRSGCAATLLADAMRLIPDDILDAQPEPLMCPEPAFAAGARPNA